VHDNTVSWIQFVPSGAQLTFGDAGDQAQMTNGFAPSFVSGVASQFQVEAVRANGLLFQQRFALDVGILQGPTNSNVSDVGSVTGYYGVARVQSNVDHCPPVDEYRLVLKAGDYGVTISTDPLLFSFLQSDSTMQPLYLGNGVAMAAYYDSCGRPTMFAPDYVVLGVSVDGRETSNPALTNGGMAIMCNMGRVSRQKALLIDATPAFETPAPAPQTDASTSLSGPSTTPTSSLQSVPQTTSNPAVPPLDSSFLKENGNTPFNVFAAVIVTMIAYFA